MPNRNRRYSNYLSIFQLKERRVTMVKSSLIKGICVNPGAVKGKARVISNPDNLNNVEYGDILVLPESHPMYAIAVMKAAGVICENGGRLSHICIVAMEMGIPCITQVRNASKEISNGDIIFLDAENGEITVERD
jgi:pyruvate,water dikinase